MYEAQVKNQNKSIVPYEANSEKCGKVRETHLIDVLLLRLSGDVYKVAAKVHR
jgi:hypothetical protein